MAKSLTETAKAILMKESNDAAPDRDATKSTPNSATLRPASKSPEADPKHNEAQDLGPAAVKATDVPPSAKAAGATKKDASASAKSVVAAEPSKKQAEVMEEDLEIEEEVVSEEAEELDEELVAFVEECIAEGMNEEEIQAAIEENFEFIDEEAEELDEETEEEYQVDMSEHVEALFAGEELSEEFKEKALTIFEAAVKQKVQEEVALIEQAFAETLEEEVAQIEEELSSNVDDYLNYVVEQWVSENEVAIEAGLRTELTEDFITGLRNLFAENYIDIPEDKVSVVEEMGAKVEELEAKLNEEIERNVVLNRMLSESKKVEIVSEMVDGLTSTQAEKLKTLAEGVEFTDVEQYAQKLKTLRESYFPSNVKSQAALDVIEPGTEGKSMIAEETLDPRMSKYVRALGKSLPQ